jgi:cold shock CspA family protein/ribosome-associated translation inhibitor RaiA
MIMILPVQVTFRNMPHSDAIEAYIREKAEGLDRYYSHIMSCRVIVEVPHRHRRQGPHSHVRIDLAVPGGEIVIKREPTLHAAQQDTGAEECTKCMEVERSHKHLKVAIREAFDTARRKLQDYARRQRADVKTHAGRPAGRVCRLYPEEGYGYIETRDGSEVYFHKNSVLNGGFDDVKIGARVSYIEEQGEKGPQASTVKLDGRHRRHRATKSAGA